MFNKERDISRIGNCPAVKTRQAPIECRDLRSPCFLHRPVEHRVAKPNHWLGRCNDEFLTAEDFEACDRWQHSDRVFTDEPIKLKQDPCYSDRW